HCDPQKRFGSPAHLAAALRQYGGGLGGETLRRLDAERPAVVPASAGSPSCDVVLVNPRTADASEPSVANQSPDASLGQTLADPPTAPARTRAAGGPSPAVLLGVGGAFVVLLVALATVAGLSRRKHAWAASTPPIEAPPAPVPVTAAPETEPQA